MRKIDTTYWREFRIGDLFETFNNGKQVPTGASICKTELKVNGSTPRISVTGVNNGIIGYYDYIGENPTNYRLFNNFISVSFLGTVFYQSDDATLDMKVHCLKPKDIVLNRYIGHFLVSSIKSSLKKSSYADQISSTKLPNLLINLPITPNNQPDWNYMECYMRQCEEVVSSKISYMNEIITGDVAERIDISSWKKFHLYDDCLFTIDSGTKLDKVKMTINNPSVNFVGRSNANNGVTDYIDEIEGIKPYDAGCLTISLGGEYLGSCFIQDKPFYTSQNVNVLIPKHNMSDYCKRFIATMIFKEGRLRYKAFIDELNRHIRTDFSILLPVTNSGTPDWKYMERYMKRVEEKTKIALRTLIQ